MLERKRKARGRPRSCVFMKVENRLFFGRDARMMRSGPLIPNRGKPEFHSFDLLPPPPPPPSDDLIPCSHRKCTPGYSNHDSDHEFQLFGEVSGDADELRKTGR